MASKEFCRPNPEELLRQIIAQEALEARGRLKIFLGYAPRVGKSQRMFDEGRRRKKRGQDVVIAAIQAKGSEDVAELIREFEVIPPVHTGAVPTEETDAIDVDAVLERAPQVCLVDELARENSPGSRYAHRWEEVAAIRARGVNVMTAINLQHIAEQQEAVERITGRRSTHTVPQKFIESADEIVIVDVPAEEVSNHGKPNRLGPAQLSELRELALLLAAQVVEQQLQRYMDTHGIMQSWGTQERILVCITPRSSAHQMIESGARAAQRFHGQLLALYVKQSGLIREAEETVEQNLEYARKLGADVHVVDPGADVKDPGVGTDNPIAEIIRFAREQRVTQLFIGHTQQSSWKFWSRNPVDKLIREAEGMDVRIFPHSSAQAA
jgi:two-component system sensor histidine kinase KdpD